MATICVFCGSADEIDPALLDLSGRVGARLAAGGHALVSGGGRVSMMGAVARAARAGGAHTLGVIPRRLMTVEVADRDADELVVVETMRERKRAMDEAADAFLALPGGLGTAGSATATFADPTSNPGTVAAWTAGPKHSMTQPNHPACRPLRTAALVIAIYRSPRRIPPASET